jgi:hypothetical protein
MINAGWYKTLMLQQHQQGGAPRTRLMAISRYWQRLTAYLKPVEGADSSHQSGTAASG